MPNLCTSLKRLIDSSAPYQTEAFTEGHRHFAHASWTLKGALEWAQCYNTVGGVQADVFVHHHGFLGSEQIAGQYNKYGEHPQGLDMMADLYLNLYTDEDYI